MTISNDLVDVRRTWATPLQEQWWFLDHWSAEHTNTFVTLPVRLSGPLDVDRLRAAADTVLALHDVLRSRFELQRGRVCRFVLPPREDVLVVVGPEVAALDVAQQVRREHGDLFTVLLRRIGPREHMLEFVAHRCVADERSLVLLLDKLVVAYRGGMLAPPPVDWEPQTAAALEHWRRMLDGVPLLDLPADAVRPTTMSFRSDRVISVLPADVVTAARREPAGVEAVLLAAVALVLGRHGATHRMVLGLGHSGRPAGHERAIGAHADTVPVVLDLAGMPAAAVVEHCRQAIETSVAHGSLSVAQLVERLGLAREASRHPVFQHAVEVITAPAGQRVGDLDVVPLDFTGVDQRLDLCFRFICRDEGIELRLDYAADLFDRRRIEHLAEHVTTLLADLLAHPERHPEELAMLGERELRALDVEWQGEPRPVDPAMMHERFARQASRTPDAIAVEEPRRRVTFAELDELSTRLAHHLRGLGVGPDVPVGVALERGIDAVTAVLGVLKAGGAYVPLDPTYPQERLRYVLTDSGARALVTARAQAELFDSPTIPVVLMDRDRELIARAPATPVESGVTPENLVYLMYTSGSTGRPKGVRTLHRNLNWYLDWFLDTVPNEAFTTVFATIAFSFDVSAMDIWPPLLTGGTVRFSDGLLAVPEGSPELRDVTMMNLVPSVLAEYLRANRLPASVHTVTIGGEQLSPKLVADLFERSEVRDVFHLYGPTETTVFVTAQHLVRGDGQHVTLGRAIHSSRIDILDEHGARVPVGAPGEIHIGGPGVADGYLDRPELTSERFLPNPYALVPGELMYRSGDIGRWNFDGEIEFLGRKDNQVKVRGVRIELGEIEATLGEHHGVAAVVVSVTERQELVAHVVGRTEALDLDLLRAHAQDRLPSFLVPSVFMRIDTIPLSPTGKVDRSALPAPAAVPRAEEGPRTATQRALCQIWESVLGCDDIGPGSHFFQSGGHSLLAIRVMREIQTVLGVKLGIRTLFHTPVLADLATAVDQKLGAA
ncbi:amino acid adenylation domain-containing protein [Lentzea sp. NPDC004782]|uniref:non-ribosomal peptide synthetase n=1 Tax=Lentzea sp. NPDC004782 TaxID=3154458 RepID=UPI0033BAD2EC